MAVQRLYVRPFTVVIRTYVVRFEYVRTSPQFECLTVHGLCATVNNQLIKPFYLKRLKS